MLEKSITYSDFCVLSYDEADKDMLKQRDSEEVSTHTAWLCTAIAFIHQCIFLQYQRLATAFDVLGISEEMQLNIYSVLVGTLYLGNIKFESIVEAESSEEEIRNAPAAVSNKDAVRDAARILKLSAEHLEV